MEVRSTLITRRKGPYLENVITRHVGMFVYVKNDLPKYKFTLARKTKHYSNDVIQRLRFA